MSFALSTYLNSGFDYVFFPSVVAVDRDIREGVLRNITAKNYEVIGITLTCTEETLLERLKARGDEGGCSFYWLHLPRTPAITWCIPTARAPGRYRRKSGRSSTGWFDTKQWLPQSVNKAPNRKNPLIFKRRLKGFLLTSSTSLAKIGHLPQVSSIFYKFVSLSFGLSCHSDQPAYFLDRQWLPQRNLRQPFRFGHFHFPSLRQPKLLGQGAKVCCAGRRGDGGRG